ncbi:hypothetical protein DPMN_054562 [Dreissena polymorpha]|uniref:Uncharacterized protein n=1 Tax=Dreissena polymorpha TaxID=45954 RepID=A0A9D4HRC9_DREPO|nr:hypothetical protein DPMN_054562 [Dreissena polymorpha]
MAEKVAMLEKQREELRDDVAYLKSQSMRNNLVFANIKEDNSFGNETAEIMETKLRTHWTEGITVLLPKKGSKSDVSNYRVLR